MNKNNCNRMINLLMRMFPMRVSPHASQGLSLCVKWITILRKMYYGNYISYNLIINNKKDNNNFGKKSTGSV